MTTCWVVGWRLVGAGFLVLLAFSLVRLRVAFDAAVSFQQRRPRAARSTFTLRARSPGRGVGLRVGRGGTNCGRPGPRLRGGWFGLGRGGSERTDRFLDFR